MDVRKSKLNVSVSVAFKVATMFLAIVVKRLLIHICGNEVNGLNALFISIIGFLSVAELGVGSAITFCMYKPIVEGDTDKVGALYQLFRKFYLIVGAVIFISGLLLLPFIKVFTKDYDVLEVNVYVTFFLILVSVVSTYLFSAKTSLINAYKNNYITTAISQGGVVLQNILQIVALLVTGSFVWYLVCRIVTVSLQYVVTEIIVRVKHGEIIVNKSKIDAETKVTLKKSVTAMFMHKVGYILVNTVDSVVISAFVGVVALGEYSNYTTILSSMVGIITLVFTSLTSVIGHLCVEEDSETAKKYCECFHLLNFIIGTVFFLGYYAVIDNVISLLFSPDLVVSKSVSFVITLNGFVQFMRRSTLTFRDATGTFYSDRWKPLIEGVVNIVLSILLVKLVGVTGVIIATIVTNLLICHVIEPYVLYKNAFSISPRRYYFTNYIMISVFTVALAALNLCLRNFSNEFTELIVNGCISVAVSLATCLFVVGFNSETTKNIRLLFKKKQNKQ